MDYRRWSRVAEWGLVAAVAGLHVAIFLWPEDVTRRNLLPMMAHDAQALSAPAVVLGWVILGPGPFWVRIMGFPALAGLWFWEVMQPRAVPTAFVATVCCGSAMLVAGLRGWDFRISRRPETPGSQRGAQFSLLALILVTTVIAAAIGLLEALRPTLNAFQGFDSAPTVPSSVLLGTQIREIVLGVAVALSGVAGFWVLLRPGVIWLRVAAAVVFVPAGSLYLTHLTEESGGSFVAAAADLALAFALVGLMIGLSVLPLRLMGYRLQRPERASRSARVGTSSTVACAAG